MSTPPQHVSSLLKGFFDALVGTPSGVVVCFDIEYNERCGTEPVTDARIGPKIQEHEWTDCGTEKEMTSYTA